MLTVTHLPAELKGELEREYRRLSMVEEQLRALEQTRTERIAHADSHPLRQVVRLMGLRAIGPNCAWADHLMLHTRSALSKRT